MHHPGTRHSGKGRERRPGCPAPRLLRLLSALIGFTALVAFTLFLFAGPWQVLVFFGDTATVLVFDLCLSMAFFVQHSGMIRRAFRAWLGRYVPEYCHGAIYSIASGMCLYAVICFWQVSDQNIGSADGLPRLGLHALFFAGLAGIAWSNLATRSLDIWHAKEYFSTKYFTFV